MSRILSPLQSEVWSALRDLLPNGMQVLLVSVRSHRIHPGQYLGLRCIAAQGRLPTSELASRFGVSRPAMTAHLDSLQARGLIVRERSTSDRRSILVRVSPKGLALLARIERDVPEAAVDLLGRIPPAQLRRMSRSLRVLDRALGDWAARSRPQSTGGRA